MCIEWPSDDPYLIYGQDFQVPMQFLEFILAPCNYLGKEYSDSEEFPIAEECMIGKDSL